MIDRWRRDFPIFWLDWLTAQRALNARRNIFLLSALYRYNILLLKDWVAWQVRRKSLAEPWDLRFLIWLRGLLAGEADNLFHRIGQRIVRKKSERVWGKKRLSM